MPMHLRSSARIRVSNSLPPTDRKRRRAIRGKFCRAILPSGNMRDLGQLGNRFKPIPQGPPRNPVVSRNCNHATFAPRFVCQGVPCNRLRAETNVRLRVYRVYSSQKIFTIHFALGGTP
jgi:hypothetical protein